MKSQRVQDEESRARERASALHKKLVQLRGKKEQEMEKKLREALTLHYQHKMEQFRNELETEMESQISSLKLVKEFKINEISEVQQVAEQTLAKLRTSLADSQELEKELDHNYQTALEFIACEQARDQQEQNSLIEAQCLQQIRKFRESVSIE